MDINNIFEIFLEDKVNLNSARQKRIQDAEKVLSKFISGSENFKDIYIKTTPQGSYRQNTIIKPVDEDAEFDVDLLIELKENSGWEPKTYLSKLAEIFKDSDRYKDITDTAGKTRCVTIDYEGDFHVDLVPTIKKDGKSYVFNKNTNKLEETDGDGYAQWFAAQNLAAHGYLVNVVKLIKYLRDRKGDFDTKSIIVTTLAGMVVAGGNYDSISKSLSSILSGLNSFLDQYQNPPTINNPAMPGEKFDRHWKEDEAGFKKLKKSISKYTKLATEAISLPEDEAVAKWKELFGDEFAPDTEDDSANKGNGNSGNYSAPEGPIFVNKSPSKPWLSSI